MGKTPSQITCYFVKKAGVGGRRTFAIARKFKNGSTETVIHKDLERINDKYTAGKLSFKQAEKAVYEVKNQLDVKLRTDRFDEDNLALLDQYWEEVYSHKPIDAPVAAFNRLRRAVEALQDVSLLTASTAQIQKKINDRKDQRTVAAALNQMLRYFGRPEVLLQLKKPESPDITYLTLDEFKEIIPHIQADDSTEDMKLLAKVAFATGGRVGECFALRRTNGKAVWIDRQRYKDGEYGPVKNHKSRWAPIVPTYKKDVEEWINWAEDEKFVLRNLNHAAIIKAACIAAFPRHKRKHLTFHSLRHCYAIWLLDKGNSLTTVARCLGNSFQVTQDYYAGYTLTDEGLANVKLR